MDPAGVSIARLIIFFEKNIEGFPFWGETYSWNSKQPFINGCFNWMISNLYIGNGCFTKHPFFNGCLGFQVFVICRYLESRFPSTDICLPFQKCGATHVFFFAQEITGGRFGHHFLVQAAC